MKRLASLLSTLSVLILLPLQGHAWGENKSLKECSKLLPKGHTFTFQLSGTVDTTKDKPDFKAQMSLTDGSGEPKPELEKLTKPFVKCVVKVIK